MIIVEIIKKKNYFFVSLNNIENYNYYYKNEKTRYFLINKDINLTNCENIITFKSPYDCPLINFYTVFRKLKEMRIISSVILLKLGLYLLLLG